MSECESFGHATLSMSCAQSSARVTAHSDRIIISIDGGATGLYVHLSFEEADTLADMIQAATAHAHEMRVLASIEPAREPESVS